VCGSNGVDQSEGITHPWSLLPRNRPHRWEISELKDQIGRLSPWELAWFSVCVGQLVRALEIEPSGEA